MSTPEELAEERARRWKLSEEYQVVKNVLKSRLVLLVFQFFVNIIVPDHEATGVFINPNLNGTGKSLPDKVILGFFSGINRWDAHYFTFIAANGYDEESKLVFLPLFPIILWGFSSALHTMTFYVFEFTTVIVVSSFLLNSFFFLGSTLILYRLTQIFFPKNPKMPLRTANFFIISPASIFFLSTYTESQFCFLTFAALLAVYEDQSYYTAMLLVGFSTLTRSNGLVTFGFIIHELCFRWLNKGLPFEQYLMTALMTKFYVIFFFGYQFNLRAKYCLPGYDKAKFTFCEQKIPFPYSYLQTKFWNLGFLNYWKVRKLPNFLLAAPIIIICIISACKYFGQHTVSLFFSLGLWREKKKIKGEDNFWTNRNMTPFVLHFLFLTFYGLLFIHVEVVTRIVCSSSPILYWIAASIDPNSKWSKIMAGYFLAYIILGFSFHCNFLPWT